MKIDAFILVHNEELLMPYIIRHYSQFADVTILDNNSTDKTIDIAHKMGATAWKYDIPDEMDSPLLTTIKNECWYDSKADWVMVVDADEFIYHPDLVNILTTSTATVIQPKMFNMFADRFPTTEGQIYNEVVMGMEYKPQGFYYSVDHLDIIPNNKINIFNPCEISKMNFYVGCHNANPTGNVIRDENSGILTLHMKYLSKEYVLERNHRFGNRLSSGNIFYGAGLHYKWSDQDTLKYIDECKSSLIKVI